MKNIHDNVHVFVLSCKFKQESTKTCFHVNFPFSAYFYPNGKRVYFWNIQQLVLMSPKLKDPLLHKALGPPQAASYQVNLPGNPEGSSVSGGLQ